MVNLDHVEEQLKRVGCNFRFWGRAEIRELCNILMPNETVKKCVNGRYEGGFAMLVVTDHRLLLIDKKPIFLSIEDIRFDMITEIEFSARPFNGSVHINSMSHRLRFTSWSQRRLRELLNYTQQRVIEIRQLYLQQQFQPQKPGTDWHLSAPAVGELALQGEGGALRQTLPLNPYSKMPLLSRRRRYPKFY